MTDLFGRRPTEEPGLRFHAAGVPRHLPVPDSALPGLLDGAAHRYGGRTALVCEGRRIGFRELRRTAVRIAEALAQLGVRRGDQIALLLPDCPEMVVMCHAVWRLGAVVVPGDIADRRRAVAHAVAAVVPDDRAAEVAETGGRTALRAVVTVEVARTPRGGHRRTGAPGPDAARRTRGPVAEPAPGVDPPGGARPPGPGRTVSVRRPDRGSRDTADRTRRPGPPDASGARDGRAQRRPVVVVAYRDLDPRRSRRPDSTADRDWSGGPLPEDVAVVVHRRDGTSIALRHRHLMAAAHQIAAWHTGPVPRRPRLLSLVPLWRTRSLVTSLAATLTGTRAVLVPGGDPLSALRAARRHAPTVLLASPADLRGLLERPAHEWEALGTVRTVVTAPLDAATGERVRAALDARVVEAYGPEAAAGVALANPLTADARPGTAGLALPGTRVRIAVEGFPDVDVLPGDAGELLLRGPQVAERQGGPAGGWLRTGRLAVRGPDGFVTLIGDGAGPGGPE
ncbi:AMP-binding protein [Streptomyces sp. NPDC058145]|uniref:AMP-binding protein n=1 Tax=Streptomyces sp. NPDC058145 TaxID=3346356 RepID=UPI0036E4E288